MDCGLEVMKAEAALAQAMYFWKLTGLRTAAGEAWARRGAGMRGALRVLRWSGIVEAGTLTPSKPRAWKFRSLWRLPTSFGSSHSIKSEHQKNHSYCISCIKKVRSCPCSLLPSLKRVSDKASGTSLASRREIPRRSSWRLLFWE